MLYLDYTLAVDMEPGLPEAGHLEYQGTVAVFVAQVIEMQQVVLKPPTVVPRTVIG